MSDIQPPAPFPRRRSRLARTVALLAMLSVFCTLLALGTWQVERLAWKRDLIARVNGRVHAEPVAPPTTAQWRGMDAADVEYRHVVAEGRFLYDRETLVYAATELGAGSWVMTPLRRKDGTIVFVNRGFVPADRRDRGARAAAEMSGPVQIAGLLRLDEPGGSILQANRPAEDRWYSRDVTAMAASRGLTEVAPFFIDADGTENAGGLPVGGLTRIVFPNNHLTYAITWYALALALAAGLVFVWRQERRPG